MTFQLIHRAPFAAGLLALVLSEAQLASAQDMSKKACIDSHERVQLLKNDRRFREAKAEARTCAQDSCPGVIKTECLTFLRQLEQDLPTVAVRVIDEAGQDRFDVEVYVDDVLLTSTLDGTSYEADPGRRTFRFVVPGRDPIVRQVVIRQGQKNQAVEIRLGPAASMPETKPKPAHAPPRAAEPAKEGHEEALVWPFVLGGIGLAAVGVGAAFVGVSFRDTNDLEACAPTCADDVIDPVRRRMVIGDVLIGIGGAAIGAAVIGLVIHASEDETVELQTGGLPGGGVGTRFRLTF